MLVLVVLELVGLPLLALLLMLLGSTIPTVLWVLLVLVPLLCAELSTSQEAGRQLVTDHLWKGNATAWDGPVSITAARHTAC